jgi:hypothetical protein
MFSSEMTESLNLSRTVELDVGNGPFYVCPAGAFREVPAIFLYSDGADEFFLYTRIYTLNEVGLVVDVFEANLRRLGGRPCRIPINRQGVIENNIRSLFMSRQYFDISQNIDPRDPVSRVDFTWMVST